MNKDVLSIESILEETADRPATQAGEFDAASDAAKAHLQEIGKNIDLDLEMFLAWFAAWYPYAGYRNLGPVIRDFAASRGIKKVVKGKGK